MLPPSALAPFSRELRGIFTDVDDTLTHDGALVPEAYAAVCAAHAAGLRVVPVTGRPAGWAAVLAATWPIDAAVGENGAVAFVRDGRSQRAIFWDDEAERKRKQPTLDAISADVLAHVPGARLAGDQWQRLCDLAFDVGESQTLPEPTIAEICRRIEAGGARSQRSTVHAHALAGDWDKAKMAERLARALWDEDLSQTRDRYLFVGDSPNDQAGFGYFPRSCGVANVRRFLDRLAPPPAFVATGEGGYGFAELVSVVLANR